MWDRCRVILCVMTSNLCPDDSSGGPGDSNRKRSRDDDGGAAAAADVPIWRNATWDVARAIYGDDTVDGAFPDDWLTKDNFEGCRHWQLYSAMLSFKRLYTGADGADLYELKALRCLETGRGTATTLLQHFVRIMKLNTAVHFICIGCNNAVTLLLSQALALAPIVP